MPVLRRVLAHAALLAVLPAPAWASVVRLPPRPEPDPETIPAARDGAEKPAPAAPKDPPYPSERPR